MHRPPLPPPIRHAARNVRRKVRAAAEHRRSTPITLEPAPTPRWSACYAPHSSMYFDQFGKVRACCQNTGLYLGDVTAQSIREIWESADANRMRSALERDDYSAGCDFCEWQLREGNESILFARQFDPLRPEERRPTWPRQMEFSLTNTCNLACVMCNGDWSSTIRSKREGREPLPVVYGDRFFEELGEFLPHLDEVEFLGGEPFLGKEPLRVMDMLTEIDKPIRTTITTNGTLLTDRVQRILETLAPSIVVSVDGASPDTYGSIRVGADFATVISNLDHFLRVLGPLKVSMTHCLMTVNWQEYADVLRIAERRGLYIGVNVVRFPAEQSLYQLPADELAEVVATMRSTDVSDLTGQRAEMWEGHVAALERRLGVIEADDGSLGPAHGLAGAPEADDEDDDEGPPPEPPLTERVGPFGGPVWLPFPPVGGAQADLAPLEIEGATKVGRFRVEPDGGLRVEAWDRPGPIPLGAEELDAGGVQALADAIDKVLGQPMELTWPNPDDTEHVVTRGTTPEGTLTLQMSGAPRRSPDGNLVGAVFDVYLDEHGSQPSGPPTGGRS